MTNYPLGFNTWTKKELEAAIKVLKSGNFTMGKVTKEFEKKFANKFNSRYATMVNSGSSANLLTLAILKNFSGIIKKEKTQIS